MCDWAKLPAVTAHVHTSELPLAIIGKFFSKTILRPPVGLGRATRVPTPTICNSPSYKMEGVLNSWRGAEIPINLLKKGW